MEPWIGCLWFQLRPEFLYDLGFRLRNFVLKTEFRLQGRISSAGLTCDGSLMAMNFFRLRDEFRLRDRIASRMCPKPNLVFSGISSSGPNFVFKFRLGALLELQLMANNFVVKGLGISASGGVTNPGPTFAGQCRKTTPGIVTNPQSPSEWLQVLPAASVSRRYRYRGPGTNPTAESVGRFEPQTLHPEEPLPATPRKFQTVFTPKEPQTARAALTGVGTPA